MTRRRNHRITTIWVRAVLAITVAVGGSWTLSGCAQSDGGEARAEQPGHDPVSDGARVVNVEVVSVTPTSFVDFIRIVGEVEALNDITISAEEAGPIVRFAATKGAWLAQGALIAKIDDAVLRAQVAEARALAELAEEQFERQRRLWEEEQIGSEIVYLQLKSSAEAARARLTTLEERLARTEVRAPVAGIFDEKFVEIGEMVAAGTPVARVVSTRRVKVVGGIPERFALDVQHGDSAVLTFDILPGRQLTGTIGFVGTMVNADNRTIPIEIVLANPQRQIKPRMLANVQVERARLDSVFVVPQDVVQRTEDGYQVFVAGDRDGLPIAIARGVTLGPSYANQVVIESGLARGDRLITSGQGLVDDGTFIRIVQTGEEG
jgi:RND family efflux transporter MFP subunit